MRAAEFVRQGSAVSEASGRRVRPAVATRATWWVERPRRESVRHSDGSLERRQELLAADRGLRDELAKR